jgi:hypothetical protein
MVSPRVQTKEIRFHILIDKAFKESVSKAAHESWMSVGQYIREVVDLFHGARYDDAADLVMIGREVGLNGLEILREVAERKGLSVNELCLSLNKVKSTLARNEKSGEKIDQVSLFGDN